MWDAMMITWHHCNYWIFYMYWEKKLAYVISCLNGWDPAHMLWENIFKASPHLGMSPAGMLKNSMVSCLKGPTRHAYAWQIGPFWQDTLELYVWRYTECCCLFTNIFICLIMKIYFWTRLLLHKLLTGSQYSNNHFGKPRFQSLLNNAK